MGKLKEKKSQRVSEKRKPFLEYIFRFFQKDDKCLRSVLLLAPFFLITVVVLILFLTFEVRYPKEGFPAEKSTYAVSDFYYSDPDLTALKRANAAAQVLPIYDFDAELAEDIKGRCQLIFEYLRDDDVNSAVAVLSWQGARDAFQYFAILANDKSAVLEQSRNIIERYLDFYRNRYLIPGKDYDALEAGGHSFISVRWKEQEKNNTIIEHSCD